MHFCRSQNPRNNLAQPTWNAAFMCKRSVLKGTGFVFDHFNSIKSWNRNRAYMLELKMGSYVDIEIRLQITLEQVNRCFNMFKGRACTITHKKGFKLIMQKKSKLAWVAIAKISSKSFICLSIGNLLIGVWLIEMFREKKIIVVN